MTVTQAELDDFHRFASARVGAAAEMSWDELFIEWQSTRDRDATNQAIREGLADVDAARHQPAEEAMEEIRREFGFLYGFSASRVE